MPNVIKKLKSVNRDETLILFTKDTHYDNYMDTLEGKMLPIPHCVENTKGWSIKKDISSVVDGTPGLVCSTEKIINSRIYKNTFGSDVLRDFLVENKDVIEEVEIIGLCTDICVVSNALMARQALPNTNITVDASCCAGATPETHKAALEIMKMCQVTVIGE